MNSNSSSGAKKAKQTVSRMLARSKTSNTKKKPVQTVIRTPGATTEDDAPPGVTTLNEPPGATTPDEPPRTRNVLGEIKPQSI
ncbi:839_t:CDS:2, partial [Gigaspora rosea]